MSPGHVVHNYNYWFNTNCCFQDCVKVYQSLQRLPLLINILNGYGGKHKPVVVEMFAKPLQVHNISPFTQAICVFIILCVFCRSWNKTLWNIKRWLKRQLISRMFRIMSTWSKHLSIIILLVSDVTIITYTQTNLLSVSTLAIEKFALYFILKL